MKINYASLHNMNKTHISFEAIRSSSNSCNHEHNKTSSLYAEYETRLKTGWVRVVKDLSEDLDYIGDSFEDVYSAFVKRNKLK